MTTQYKISFKQYYIAIIIYLVLLLPQPYSYSEMQQSDWDSVYNLVKNYIRQGKWEEATAALNYLRDLIKAYKEHDKLQTFKHLKIQVNKLVNKNLWLLIQKGRKQLDNLHFANALMIFKKTSVCCPKCSNT